MQFADTDLCDIILGRVRALWKYESENYSAKFRNYEFTFHLAELARR